VGGGEDGGVGSGIGGGEVGVGEGKVGRTSGDGALDRSSLLPPCAIEARYGYGP
jgi:hypothetical protein